MRKVAILMFILGVLVPIEGQGSACGSNLVATANRRRLQSPGYPGYSNNLRCQWIICSGAGSTVHLSFTTIEMESDSSCSYDYVAVYDGTNTSAPLLGKYCGSNSNTISLQSTSNVLLIIFFTDSSSTGRGFQADYMSVTCGGMFSSSSGVLQSPNFPSNYDTNATCTWYINGPFGHYINFTFESFELQSSDGCSKDFIELRHKNESGDLLGRFCGSSTPSATRFADSDAFVRFVSDSAVTARGFRMRYEASLEECGGSFTAPTGHFTSPGYPNAYPHPRECVYRIRVQLGRRIKLVIHDIRIGDSEYWCSSGNSLAVYDGSLDDSRISQLCGGNRTIAPVYSSSHTMTVVFRTDGSSSDTGFSASYTADTSGCGGLITGPQAGVILSPGYVNGSYDNDVQCTWFVVAPNGSDWSISLQFTSFDVESPCRFDYVEVREGLTENRGLLGRYCGNRSSAFPGIRSNLPPFILSPQTLRIRFRTDSSGNGRGFNMSYSFSECGGVLSDVSGVITSPNYPLEYPPNLACVWIIQAPEGHTIQFQTLDFNVQASKDCQLDYLTVTVLNGGNVSSPPVGRFCSNGTNAVDFRLMTNRVRIEFHTDAVLSSKGFKLRYNADNTGCGGVLQAADGHLTSPNFPNHYPHNTECIWDIIVAPERYVNLSFNPRFAVDGDPGACTYDYVEVSDYKNGEYMPLLHTCGVTLPPSQRSSDNRLRVKFRSDSRNNATGFSANWTTGCGFITTAQSGVFSSPGYPRGDGPSGRCEYLITGDPTELVIVEFQLLNGDSCVDDSPTLHDGLKLYDGTDTSQPITGRFCGSKGRVSASAMGSMLLVFDSTDSWFTYSGFNATFRRTPCGGELTAANGTVTSSTHLPTNHRSYACAWNITVKHDGVVEITFSTSFGYVPPNSPCGKNYIEVHDGIDRNAPSLGRICGSTSDLSIRSTGNRMKVTVVSDGSTYSPFFTVSYRTALRTSCGGELKADHGTITSSAHLPTDYQNFACTWTITVKQNGAVEIMIGVAIFHRLDSTCHSSYIEVHDGVGPNAPSLGRFCGYTSRKTIRSNGNRVKVTVVSDGLTSSPSILLVYRTTLGVKQGCGGVLTAPSGTIVFPPNTVDAVGLSLNCTWFISLPGRAVPLLTFNSLDISYHSMCVFGYVQIRDGNSSAAPLIGRYCSTTTLNVHPITASFNNIAVTLVSKIFGSRSLFSMSYTSVDVCTWGTWSTCSSSCGHGYQRQERTCTGHSSSCNTSCDNDQVTRTRLCRQPLNGGGSCIGDSTEWKKCETGRCPVDGMWSDWDEWTPCTKKCGGYRTRQRQCGKPTPPSGRDSCNASQWQTDACQNCDNDRTTSRYIVSPTPTANKATGTTSRYIVSPTTTAHKATGDPSSNVATIAGITVGGGIVVIIVIVFASIVIYKRSRTIKARERSTRHQPGSSNAAGNIPPHAYVEQYNPGYRAYNQAGAGTVYYDNKAFSRHEAAFVSRPAINNVGYVSPARNYPRW